MDYLIKPELKIVRWIQYFRTTEAALNKLYSKEELDRMKQEVEFRMVSLDEDGDDKETISMKTEKAF